MAARDRSEFARLFVAFFNPQANPLPSPWPDLGRLAGLLAAAAAPVCAKEN